jgi:hypothetical protein
MIKHFEAPYYVIFSSLLFILGLILEILSAAGATGGSEYSRYRN